MRIGYPNEAQVHRMLLTCVLLPVFAIAQSQNAELTGTITDPSGGLVPGAQVTVTNVNTGEKRTTTSNEAGIYTIVVLANSDLVDRLRIEPHESIAVWARVYGADRFQ